MNLKKHNNRKKPLSTGKDGKLDSRRWVVITLRNNGASEAQFPLPVSVNCERIAFARDTPTIAPAYYLDTLDNAVLPRYVKKEESGQNQNGNQVRSEDEADFVGLKYQVDIEEIPMEYQTVEGIEEFFHLTRDEECPEHLTHLRNCNFGQVSIGQLSYSWSEQNKKSKRSSRKPVGAADSK